MNSTSSTLNALLIGAIVVAIMFLAIEVLIRLALARLLSFMLAAFSILEEATGTGALRGEPGTVPVAPLDILVLAEIIRLQATA